MELLKGMPLVKEMKETLRREAASMERPPVLAIVRVGEKPDDLSYERGAKKRMEGIGIAVVSRVFDTDIPNQEFQEAFMEINSDPQIDGILLLRPLPKQIDEKKITELIDPAKDVDGISPVNMARIFMDDPDGFAPCTAEAVVELLKSTGMELAGKRAVIAGRSLVVGKPLAMLLMKENCTVTICHSKTKDMAEIIKEADILAAAIGKARLIDGSWIKPGAVVLDVGIHVEADKTMCGDVDFASLSEEVAMATPVPGGVGSVTTSILAKHVISAAKNKSKDGMNRK